MELRLVNTPKGPMYMTDQEAMYYGYNRQVSESAALGFVPLAIAGTKIGASTVASVANAILPGLFKDRYAEANQAITQVSQLATNTGQSAQQVQTAANQAITAYRQTIQATKAKAGQLQQLPEQTTNNTTGKVLLGATLLVTVAGIAINKLA